MLGHSTSRSIKVGAHPCPPRACCTYLTLFPRDNGRDDDRKGRRLGSYAQLCHQALSQNRTFQDPPEQVIQDCTREVDDALR
jgi:hypothetical protein